jgi:glycosyltransferase involved in cell wall biosynthesis
MLVSFVVCAYKQEEYIEEAILSAFAQTYEPLEIIISDDCSPDRTFDVIQKTLSAHSCKHKVITNRNQVNLGLAGNLNQAFALARGELVVIQAGDDSSVPERTSELATAYRSRMPRPDLVFSNVLFVDGEGRLLKTQIDTYEIPTLEQVIRGKWFIAGGMACAYSRQMLDFYGPLDRRIIYEDYVFTFRALARNGIMHVPMPLVRYRVHDQSIMAHENKVVFPSRQRSPKVLARNVAQEEDRYNSWRKSGRTNILDRLILKRRIAFHKADTLSSNVSRPRAVLCLLWAILTLRPSFAKVVLMRDILRLGANPSQKRD